MKKITVTLRARGGERVIDLEGFQGQGCSAVVDSFGAGAATLEKTAKPEYFEEETLSERERELQ